MINSIQLLVIKLVEIQAFFFIGANHKTKKVLKGANGGIKKVLVGANEADKKVLKGVNMDESVL
ncbi:hypothetical protein [uncultured Holdemanella sp.]|uniref:hypothetical protein n=1 Tax=uncultured Holdemanella sp. TaxID=1763549 RepID=UPI0025CFAA0B|nr:hypothetical protein [uncultured Holdemanella sp.]